MIQLYLIITRSVFFHIILDDNILNSSIKRTNSEYINQNIDNLSNTIPKNNGNKLIPENIINNDKKNKLKNFQDVSSMKVGFENMGNTCYM